MFSSPRRVATLVVGCAILMVGCTDVTGIPEPVTAPLQPFAQGDGLRAALRAQDRHTEALMRTPGVLGTAVSLLANGRPGIRVFVLDASPRDIRSEERRVGKEWRARWSAEERKETE